MKRLGIKGNKVIVEMGISELEDLVRNLSRLAGVRYQLSKTGEVLDTHTGVIMSVEEFKEIQGKGAK